MLAKAIAKESGASFISTLSFSLYSCPNIHGASLHYTDLRISTLTEKWFGESQKLVKGVFTLARKIQPTIIFIDEIDSFLRSRQSNDHEVTAMMKAEFMSLWDGLTTDDDVRIVVRVPSYFPSQDVLDRSLPPFCLFLDSWCHKQTAGY